MSEISLDDILKSWANSIFGLAQLYNINLDYTEESIIKVEDLCEIIYRQIISNNNTNEANIKKVSNIIGSYLGEIIIKNIGGQWKLTENKVISVVLKNQSVCYPIGKVYKRLTNGIEDDIMFYYKVLKERISQNQVGLT